jgi:hypothetical protein
MANDIGWGQGSINNTNGWGQGANNSNGWGNVQLTSYSGETEIDGGNIPTNTVAPSITGIAKVGQVVSCSTGTWSGIPTYTFQWYRDEAVISDGINSDYILVTDDIGANISCIVTATNFIGSATADSNIIVPIASTDADAQAFITAASITDDTQKSAINTLVTDLKGYGIWTKMKAIYPFVGGTASTHKYNLKDPRDLDAAYRLVFSGGWTHSNNGATPNGTNGFADTFLIPNNILSVNSAHIAKYNRTNDILGIKVDGCYSNPTTSYFQQNFSSANGIIGNGAIASYTATDSRGLFITSRTTNSLIKVIRNTTLLATNTSSVSAIPLLSFCIGARNDGSKTYYNSYQAAFASLGDGLNDTETANLYTAVQAFQTTLSRNV